MYTAMRKCTECCFCAHLANEGLKYRTIKVYLSAVRHLQIAERGNDPFGGAPMACLEYVIRGVKRKRLHIISSGREGETTHHFTTPQPYKTRVRRMIIEPTSHSYGRPVVFAFLRFFG